MGGEVRSGDRVVLIDGRGRRHALVVEDRNRRFGGFGVFNPARLAGLPYGAKVVLGEREYTILPFSLADFFETFERRAQVILPRDGAVIAAACAVGPGSVVVEGGTGSGALTALLAHATGPAGKVVTYDLRAEHIEVAKRNLALMGMEERVAWRERDIAAGIGERDVDAVILDIPEPWSVAETAHAALKAGGHLAAYVPSVNQMERFVRRLRELPFVSIFSFELLQREMVVGERGVRPSFEMLGHTGYITVARKVVGGEPALRL